MALSGGLAFPQPLGAPRQPLGAPGSGLVCLSPCKAQCREAGNCANSLQLLEVAGVGVLPLVAPFPISPSA